MHRPVHCINPTLELCIVYGSTARGAANSARSRFGDRVARCIVGEEEKIINRSARGASIETTSLSSQWTSSGHQCRLHAARCVYIGYTEAATRARHHTHHISIGHNWGRDT